MASILGLELDIDHEGNTSVHVAAANGQDSEMSSFSRVIDTNVTNSLGWTPLMYSAYYGHVDVVKRLLSLGADVNMRNKFGGSVMTLAAASGSVIVVRAIVEANFTNSPESDFVSPLAVASLYGHLPVTRFLIDYGFDPNTAIPCSGITPLMLAVFENNVEVVQLLVDRGASITSINLAGYSALDLAMLKGHSEIISFLHKKMRKDLILCHQRGYNKEAVAQAAKTGNLLYLRNLLSQSPVLATTSHWSTNMCAKISTDLCHCSDGRYVCLSRCIQSVPDKSDQLVGSCYNSFPRCLIANDRESTDHRRGSSGFIFSSSTNSNYHGISNYCIKNENSSSVNIKVDSDDSSKTTIYNSSTYNFKIENIPCTSEEHCIKVHSKNFSELHFDSSVEESGVAIENDIMSSPLMLACSHGCAKVARFLIAAGADPNPQRGGRTPLMLAAIGSHTELAKLLLSVGADPLASSSKDNLTAFDLASLFGADTELTRLLAFQTLPPSAVHSDKVISAADLIESDCFSSPFSILKKIKLTLSPKADSNLWPKEYSQNPLAERINCSVLKPHRYKWLRNDYSRELTPTLARNNTDKKKNSNSKSYDRWKFKQLNLPQDNPYSVPSHAPFDMPFRLLPSDKVPGIMPPIFTQWCKLNQIMKNKFFEKDKKTIHVESSGIKITVEPIKNINLISSANEEIEYDNKVLTTNISSFGHPSVLTDHKRRKQHLSIKSSSSTKIVEKSKEGEIPDCFNTKSHEPKNTPCTKRFGQREDFNDFLKRTKLEAYTSLFKEHEVEDVDIILSLKEVDLEEMGIECAVEKTKILNSIHKTFKVF